jgi:hypothetical protein
VFTERSEQPRSRVPGSSDAARRITTSGVGFRGSSFRCSAAPPRGSMLRWLWVLVCTVNEAYLLSIRWLFLKPVLAGILLYSRLADVDFAETCVRLGNELLRGARRRPPVQHEAGIHPASLRLHGG